MPEKLSGRADSWVASANDREVGFPLQSLPYCAFSRGQNRPDVGAHREAHLGVGIGSFVLDLHELVRSGGLDSLPQKVRTACMDAQLNALMGCGRAAWQELRSALIGLLREDAPMSARGRISDALLPMAEVQFHKPVAVGNYTDFYASMHHARNVGRLFRPEQPLLPNYGWVPIGYHGRASSVVVSGTEVRRPWGQYRLAGADAPVFRPTAQLDYELEVAAYIGLGNELGAPIGVGEAGQHLFGISLLNDWSARDIQAWEAQPLGPFLGKSFATSVSPWVVPMEALRGYRAQLKGRGEEQPAPLAYLREGQSYLASGFDVQLEVYLRSDKMRKDLAAPTLVSRASLLDLSWSFPQMVAHHTSNGCNLLTGDMLASGTVSGAEAGAQGCLLEITRRGTDPLTLANGETRTFLEDGDEVILRGFCDLPNLPRITLGECRGRVQPAVERPGSLHADGLV